MQIHIVLENQREELTALQVARFLADLQHLASFSIALANWHGHQDSGFARFEEIPDTYESKINADRAFDESFAYPPEPSLHIKQLTLNSPLTVKVGFFFRGNGKALRSILELIKTIVTLDHIRRGAAIENEVRAQEVFRARLKNFDEVLKLSSRFTSQEEREAVERSIARAIVPFVDGRYPAVARMDVIEPR